MLDREDAWWEAKCAMHAPSLPRAEAQRHLAKLCARLGCSWRQLCLSPHAAWLCGQLAVCKVAHRVSSRSMDTGPWEPLVRSQRRTDLARLSHTACVACPPCTAKGARAAQEAPHEQCVTALLSPPWVFVHEAHSPHFFLKLMSADHVHCADLAALVAEYSSEASRHWPAYGLEQRKAWAPF